MENNHAEEEISALEEGNLENERRLNEPISKGVKPCRLIGSTAAPNDKKLEQFNVNEHFSRSIRI